MFTFDVQYLYTKITPHKSSPKNSIILTPVLTTISNLAKLFTPVLVLGMDTLSDSIRLCLLTLHAVGLKKALVGCPILLTPGDARVDG